MVKFRIIDGMKFREFIKKKREKLGISQQELANRLKINWGYLNKIECGKMPPPSDNKIVRMAKILEVDEDYLLYLAHYEKVPPDIQKIIEKSDLTKTELQLLSFIKEISKKVEKYPDDVSTKIGYTLRHIINLLLDYFTEKKSPPDLTFVSQGHATFYIANDELGPELREIRNQLWFISRLPKKDRDFVLDIIRMAAKYYTYRMRTIKTPVSIHDLEKVELLDKMVEKYLKKEK